jgi:hypothetical protein
MQNQELTYENFVEQMLWDLIAAWFVENLTPSYEEDVPTYYAIRNLLGPKLLAQLMLADPYEDWYRLNPPKWRKS